MPLLFLVVLPTPAARLRCGCTSRSATVVGPVVAARATARVKERPEVELVDLPVFGRQARLVWRKHRLLYLKVACPVMSWTVEDLAIASPGWP